MKANPYEFVRFWHPPGKIWRWGRNILDRALRYNETPQGWYYYGYVNYYISNNEPDKALEALKQGTKTGVEKDTDFITTVKG